MKFILGTKQGMTQVFREDGAVVPVTCVQAGPCVVTQVKDKAIQIGFGAQKKFRVNKAKQGHLKDIKLHEDNNLTVRCLRDFSGKEESMKRGDVFTVEVFTPGDKVQVTGNSKGRGFQGVVKRHGFHGSPASHGHKDQLRMPGSIGATDAARVFKGKRMPGHMGDAQVTVKNLEIVEVHPDDNELLIKGAVPGARGGLLLISTENGKMELQNPEEPKEKKVEEAPKKEVKEEKKEEKPVEEAPKKEEKKTEEPKAEEKPKADKKE